MAHEKTYVPLQFHKVLVTDSDIKVQLLNHETRKKTEAFLVVHQDKVTGELSLDVARHFVDPTSHPWFADSQPWDSDVED